MGFIEQRLKRVPIPEMALMRQRFPRPVLGEIEEHIDRCFSKAAIRGVVGEAKNIAVAVGSRGIENLPLIVRCVVRNIRELGAGSFIFPAMGSHGGATSAGQKQILEDLGITEEAMGAPIHSSMEAVPIGATENGLPVFLDKYALEADGVIVINKIRPHVGFRGDYECGLMKMIAIGAGKQKGAEACHAAGFRHMAQNIFEAACLTIAKNHILLGIGILENACNEVCRIEFLPPEEIIRKEPELLREAHRLAPSIPFDRLDVLIIDEIGKNIAGTGMDTNVVGRYHTPYAWGGPDIAKIIVLDLTELSRGNANGIGIADFTTHRAYRKISFENTYPNSLTSTVQNSVKIPMVLDNDRQAIAAAIQTCNIKNQENVRLAWIKNTKELEFFYASASLSEEMDSKKNLDRVSPFREILFDKNGNIHRSVC